MVLLIYFHCLIYNIYLKFLPERICLIYVEEGICKNQVIVLEKKRNSFLFFTNTALPVFLVRSLTFLLLTHSETWNNHSFLYLLLAFPTGNFGPLPRGSSNLMLTMMLIFDPKVTGDLAKRVAASVKSNTH